MNRDAMTMKRKLITGLASLLALGLVAPAAQAATQTRHFQDRSLSGPVVNQLSGELRLDVVYKDKHGNKKFTPRSITLYQIEVLPVSCEVGGQQFMAAFGPTDPIKVTKGKYNHDFAEEGFEGGLAGKAIKTDQRMEGKLNVIDVDFSPTQTNCSTNGPRSYSATPCRTANNGSKLPVCRVGGGS